MDPKIKVVDNFLDTYQFDRLYSVMMGDQISWFYNEYTTREGDGMMKYTHRFDNPGNYSPFMPIIEPLLVKINAVGYYRINSNILHRTRFFNQNTGFHTDGYDCPNTAIFYINTCNGYTKFKNGPKVMSVANRMLFFPSDMEHAGFTCTDEERRLIINFNYE
tara:strand:+ start:168 stop:653 length:486 start_codon:yes stop_codon:yes gene_type:complete